MVPHGGFRFNNRFNGPGSLDAGKGPKAVFGGLVDGYGWDMSAPKNPIIVIPARLASARLPDKPILDILGEPMIVHVWRRAVEAGVGPVIVACADALIVDAVKKVGGDAVFTNPGHASGSDRVFEAMHTVDPLKKHDCVINLQGDLPTIGPETVLASLLPLADPEVDIATLAAEITDPAELDDPNVVKAVLSFPDGGRTGRALYFTRATAPSGPGPCYHHIGLYAFRRQALEKFVNLPRGKLEQQEKLEQLRALEAGMRIDAQLVDTVPLGVDTPADLERARELMAP